MSRRLEVLKAVKALVAAAVPLATTMGLDGDEAAPTRVGDGGRIIVRSGDPGEPEIDLSPLCYNYNHRIPIELTAYKTATGTSEEALDVMLTAIGEAILADRHLGGLVIWLDAIAPETDDIFSEGAAVPRGADMMIVASYSTTSPLT